MSIPFIKNHFNRVNPFRPNNFWVILTKFGNSVITHSAQQYDLVQSQNPATKPTQG